MTHGITQKVGARIRKISSKTASKLHLPFCNEPFPPLPTDGQQCPTFGIDRTGTSASLASTVTLTGYDNGSAAPGKTISVPGDVNKALSPKLTSSKLVRPHFTSTFCRIS
jgi:hypothetical protein